MRLDVITIFPTMFRDFLSTSMVKRAIDRGAVVIRIIDLRDFTSDPHRTVDDRPYGGGAGMLMKPEPLFAAVESLREQDSHVVLLTPQGRCYVQEDAQLLSRHEHVIFVCGHYEGVDERVREALVDEEISIGDYVLTNGNLAAMVVMDAAIRLLPGVLGCDESTWEESFSGASLEYPQYTRPQEFRGMRVPDVLLSGNHEEIRLWRAEQSRRRTQERRPDLLGHLPNA